MIKSRIQVCLLVANAKVDFPSRSGIAYFAKVSSGDDTIQPQMLSVRGALLDDLYICDGCDGEGVPDLTRSSGKHTEDHHLIRCLAPEKTHDKDKATLTKPRLTSMESRLDGMQAQLDGLTGRVGDLVDRIGDLTGHFGDLNARIGNIEQLLHRLVGAAEGRAAA